MSDDETNNIESRQALIKQYQYIIHIINQDISGYVRFGVLKRLGVSDDKNYTLSPDNKTLTIS